jgi:hypothetical protein
MVRKEMVCSLNKTGVGPFGRLEGQNCEYLGFYPL